MPWNTMQIELILDDGLIMPLIGGGGMTREQAHDEVQAILDRVAGELGDPLASVADTWRRGHVKDDTLYWQAFIWTIYEHADGEDPRRAAMVWLDDFASIMRRAGVNANVARGYPRTSNG